jgi:hypothetical protein
MFGACFAAPHNSQSRHWSMRIATSARDGGWQSGKTLKFDPRGVLFALRHGTTPSRLTLSGCCYKESRQWFAAVATSLFGELNRRDPHPFDQFRTAAYCR